MNKTALRPANILFPVVGLLALAWVLQNDAVSAAIIGATRPEQIADNVKASGVTLDEATMAAIDAALGDVVFRDPELTRSPETRP